MVSGAVSAALGGISLGGAQALSNPATREVVKKSFGEAMKTFLKGSGKEMTQEALDSGVNTIASEMTKGKTLKEATATAFEQLPETLATAGAMGGGVETAAHLIQGTQWDHHDGVGAAASPAPAQQERQQTQPGQTGAADAPQTRTPAAPPASAPGGQGEAGGQPQAASAGSQQGIPQTAMPSETGTAPPENIPVPTFEEAVAARNTADKLKAQEGALSAEQQQTLDAAEKTFARKTEDNILKQQAGIERRGGKLHEKTVKALEEARAVLARPGPEGNVDSSINPDNTTSYHRDARQPSQTPDSKGQPSSTSQGAVPPSTPPLSVETSQRLIHNVMNRPPRARNHPTTQADLAQAQRVVQAHVQKLESQTAPLSEGQRRELADAKTALGRLGTERIQNARQLFHQADEVTHVAGTAADPTVHWKDNPEGTPERTIEQAKSIAKEHGVRIPEWVQFQTREAQFYGENTWAKYCSFGPPLTHVSWKNFLGHDGKLIVGIDERLLKSDEGIVGIFAHEMHEVNALYEILRYGDSISMERLGGLINDPHGLLHQQGWDISDKKISQMREAKYDARERRF